MEENEKFFNELNIITQSNYKEIMKRLEGIDINLISLAFEASLNNDILTKYGLNDDIEFLTNIGQSQGQTDYYYKGDKLEPINLQIRTKDYHPVTTLEILQQCVIQDTNKPDIRFLEERKKEM